jgi:hypothetical protein
MTSCAPSWVAVFVAEHGVKLIAIRRGFASALALLLVSGAATGCTSVVGGSMRPAPGLAPRPLTGPGVQQALLDAAALSRAFGQSFTADPDTPTQTGGAELLQANAMTPPDCGGVSMMLLGDTYAGSQVRDVASESWLYASRNPAVIIFHEAVVALPSVGAAAARFAALQRQWARCDGASMTIGGDANYTFNVGHVEDKDSVLSAPVDHVSGYMLLPAGRAIGVRVNCLVEVDVVYFGPEFRDGSSRHTPSAADAAHLLMDNVSAQS